MPTSNNPVITWNDQPLTITAKVDARINHTDYMEWEDKFTPGLREDYWSGENGLFFNGYDPNCTYGDQYLAPGLWRFTVTEGICDAEHPIALFTNPDQPDETLFKTFTAIGDTVEILIELPNDLNTRVIQNVAVASASMIMQRISYFDDNNYLPKISKNGDTLAVHWDYMPRSGILTATAKVYDGNGFLIATSDAITLNITSNSNSGGE